MSDKDKNFCQIDIDINDFRDILFKERNDDVVLSPFDYLVTKSEYVVSIENQMLIIELKLKLTTLTNKLVKLVLLNSSVVILSSNTNKGELGFDGTNYSFFSNKSDNYDIYIKYTKKIKYLGLLNNLELAIISNSLIKFILPIKDNYSISSFISLSQNYEKNKKIVEFYSKDKKVNITWGNIKKKEEKVLKNILPSIIHSRTQTIINITSSSISYNSKIKCNIYQSPISELKFEIKNAQIIEIKGKYIKRYDISDDNKVIIYFDKEIEGNYDFNVYYEKELNIDEEFIDISSISINNSERDEGYLAILSRSISEIELIDLNDIRIIDINELPEELKKENQIKEALKYLKTSYSFRLKLIKHKEIEMPVSIIKNMILDTVVLKKGISLSSIYLEIKNNSKPFIEIELPRETSVLSSFIKGMPVKPIKSENNNMMISLPKFTSSQESFWIEIILLSKLNKMTKTGSIEISLPKFDISISHLFWKLYLPEKFKYKKFRGNIEKFDYFKTEPPFYPYNQEESYSYYKEEPYEYANNEKLDDMYDDYEEEPAPKILPNMVMSGAIAPKVKPIISRNRSMNVKNKKVAKTSMNTSSKVLKSQFNNINKSNTNSFIQKQIGKIPIKIYLPLVGNINYYEKLFIENESVKLKFNYKKKGKSKVEEL